MTGHPSSSAGPRTRPRAVSAGLVRIDQIHVHPWNVRRDLGDLTALTDSIRRHGVLQPVVVEVWGRGFRLRLGQRRVAAASAAGLTMVPAIIHSHPLDETSLLLQTASSNTGLALSAADKHRAAARLRERGATWRQIARAFSTSTRVAARWVLGDGGDQVPGGDPRKQAVRRLIEAHQTEFDELLELEQPVPAEWPTAA